MKNLILIIMAIFTMNTVQGQAERNLEDAHGLMP